MIPAAIGEQASRKGDMAPTEDWAGMGEVRSIVMVCTMLITWTSNVNIDDSKVS